MKVIQIIEDDSALRENSVELLELNGYKMAASVIDAKSSVEIFRSIKPDLIICDLEKQQSSGYDFIKFLKVILIILRSKKYSGKAINGIRICSRWNDLTGLFFPGNAQSQGYEAN